MPWTPAARSRQIVMLAEGLVMVTSSARFASQLSNGATVDLEVAFDADLGRVVATSVRVSRGGDGTEVTTTLLQEMHVQDALVTVSLNWLVGISGRGGTFLPAAEALGQFRPARGRDRSEKVRDAAAVYVMATVVNLPPLKTVAETLSVSQSTATRLIAEAREVRTLEKLEATTIRTLTAEEIRAFVSRPDAFADG